MPFTISGTLRSKLPLEEKEEIREILLTKADSKCFLCELAFNENTDLLEVDHDVPESLGGETKASNLNLTHQPCNRSKKGLPTEQIRPYIKFMKFMENLQGPVKYDGVLPHFGIEPALTKCTLGAETVSFIFPETTESVEVPVYHDVRGGVTFYYCFLKVPKRAIYNDNAIQPRNIDLDHVRKIYTDILQNPLHEPANVRIDIEPHGEQNCDLKLFDGQHKTIATWLQGDDSVCCKVYFNIPIRRATRLVNSIQSLITKLPLSALESGAKMSEEHQSSFNEYVQSLTGDDLPTETGFIEFHPKNDQARVKKAFKEGLAARLLEDDLPEVAKYTRKGSKQGLTHQTITERALITKLFGQLIESKPLSSTNRSEMRDRERVNIARMVNCWLEPCFAVTHGDESGELRQSRMSYQGSLSMIGYAMKLIFARVVNHAEGEQPLLFVEPTADQWERIEHQIGRLGSHPLWMDALTTTPRLRALQNSMQKNQGWKDAFREAHLDLVYFGGDGPPQANWRGSSE